MKKLGKVKIVLIATFASLFLPEALKAQNFKYDWVYDQAVMVDNLKTADRYYATSVNLSENYVEMEVALVWTDYGRTFNGKDGVDITVFFIQVDRSKEVFRIESTWDVGFSGNIVSKELWPFGEDKWWPDTRDEPDSSKTGLQL